MDGPSDLVAALRGAGGDVDEVAEVVRARVSDPDGMEAALGVEDRCGITNLWSSPDLTIQRIVWPAGIEIPPHDHRMWAVVGVYRGREDNCLFTRNATGLRETGSNSIDEGTVVQLGTDAIHAVANSRSAPCVALHVYGGDLDNTSRSNWIGPDRLERRFDNDAMRNSAAALRRREDELGRPLARDETRALMSELRPRRDGGDAEL